MAIIKPTIRAEIYNKVLVMIDNFTEDGTPIADEDNADIEAKVIQLTDMSQKEMWRHNKITKQDPITRKPPENLLASDNPHELIDFEGETQYIPSEEGIAGPQGYSIRVNGDCTLTYEENIAGVWTQIVQEVPTGIEEMTEYKGQLLVTDTTNKVRLKIEGTTHFLHEHRALWKILYPATRVPSFAYWIKVEMKDDFNAVDMVVREFGNGIYDQMPNYKIENYRDFYIAFDFEGTIRITYNPIPPTVTSLDDLLQIDVSYAQNIVYDVLAKIGFYENPDVVNWAEGRRQEGQANVQTDEAPSAVIITDYYS